jgi:hypothetical protein
MSEWKDTPTVSGLIVRAVEQNPYIETLEKFRIIYLLAFASTSFLIKFACVISERDTNMNPTGWLLKFIDVVEDALSNGLPEETYLDATDQQALKNSYERIMKMNSAGDEDYCEVLPLVAHPYRVESWAQGKRPPNECDRDRVVINARSKLELLTGGTNPDVLLSNAEFWAD